jgi:hypothetical protein
VNNANRSSAIAASQVIHLITKVLDVRKRSLMAWLRPTVQSDAGYR